MSKKEDYDLYNEIVKMHNNFINARGKTGVLLTRLLAISLYRLEMDEDGNLDAETDGDTLKRYLGSNSHSLFKNISNLVDPPKKSMPSLLDFRQIYKNPENEEIAAYNVITSATFKNNTLKVRFNKDLAPILYTFKDNYAQFKLGVLLSFKSKYSQKLYQILCAEYGKLDDIEKKKGKPSRQPYTIIINMVDLKMRLGIIDSTTTKVVEALKKHDYDKIEELTALDEEASKYKDYGNLRKNALEKAKKEINNKEDAPIYFDFEPIRSGRGGKASSVKFNIYSKNPRIAPKNNNISDNEKDKVIDEICEIIDENLKFSEYRAIAEAAEYDVYKVKEAYELSKQSKNIENIVGWLIKAIKEEYKASSKIIDTTTFRMMKSSDFNYAEHEEELLDN